MKNSITWDIQRVPSTTSTMDDARAAARAGAAEGWAIVADTMTGGRGTQKREWHAPPGGLYTSFILREPGDIRLLTMTLGVAVCDVLEVAGLDARLKWVNDVWVAGRKVAGILVEAEATGDRTDFLVCGIGINVNGKRGGLPGPLASTATTVEEELGCDQCIPDLEALLWERIGTRLDELRAGQGHLVLDYFGSHDALRGKRVKVDDGTTTTTGTANGVDGKGRLVVDTSGGAKFLSGGTVTLA